MTLDPSPLTPSPYRGPIPRHPAKWSRSVLEVIERIIVGRARARYAHPDLIGGQTYRVLDPCAGVGGIHALAAARWDGTDIETWTVDCQAEWVAALRDDPDLNARSLVGDATRLPPGFHNAFDAAATSLVYPNRMTDSHEAKDACKACGGSGCVNPSCLGGHPDDGEVHDRCKTCKGSGLSRRNTYRHALDEVGATVAPGSVATSGWGSKYQRLNGEILGQVELALRPYGILLLNMSNHIADGQEVPVVEWYITHMLSRVNAGGRPVWVLDRVIPIETPRNRQGANGDARVAHEFLLAFHRRY